jgi:hypothetical protein
MIFNVSYLNLFAILYLIAKIFEEFTLRNLNDIGHSHIIGHHIILL